MPRPRRGSSRVAKSQKAMPATAITSRTSTAGVPSVPVMKNQLNMALKIKTRPSRPARRPQFLEVICLAPAMRLDRAIGREQAEDDDRKEVENVFHRERAFGEGLQVAAGGEVHHEVA